MTTGVSIEATCMGGQPLDVLGDLIAQRVKYLKDETTERAVIATAINVVTSLRASTKKAPHAKAPEGSYAVSCEIVGGAGWRGRPARRTAIQGGHRVGGIYPVNWMYGLKGSGNLYRITVTNPNIQPKNAKNKPFYLILAPNYATAVKFAKERIVHALSKEAGMARYALGIAQAKVSDRPMRATAPSGSMQMQRAYAAAQITKAGGDGTFSISVRDALNYSKLALKGGESDFQTALMKAANRTAGLINHLAGYKLDEKIQTPFPEVQRK